MSRSRVAPHQRPVIRPAHSLQPNTISLVSAESTAVHEGRAEVRNLQGMHFRPVGLLAQLAMTFKSAITISYEGSAVDAKSAIALTMLGAPQGAELLVRAEGPDAAVAVTSIVDLINNRFGLKDTD